MPITKKEYIKYLNEVGETLDEDEFIMGGKYHKAYYPHKYGECLYRYDPIAFEVSYKDYVREHSN